MTELSNGELAELTKLWSVELAEQPSSRVPSAKCRVGQVVDYQGLYLI